MRISENTPSTVLAASVVILDAIFGFFSKPPCGLRSAWHSRLSDADKGGLGVSVMYPDVFVTHHAEGGCPDICGRHFLGE
jgi:hypothetical protein